MQLPIMTVSGLKMKPDRFLIIVFFVNFICAFTFAKHLKTPRIYFKSTITTLLKLHNLCRDNLYFITLAWLVHLLISYQYPRFFRSLLDSQFVNPNVLSTWYTNSSHIANIGYMTFTIIIKTWRIIKRLISFIMIEIVFFT